ncbi:HAD family hydrolase [Dactylosporangium sp. NPDC005572]|uniref:HAD family hydrolase n=1 Tax=Dactylosporangium sp. NPDC005572 TaxID=3156889 RepID=UPI0033AE39E1
MTKPVSGVLFDVDGTLVDSVYLHVVSWWQAFRQHGHDVEAARIHRAIGMGPDRILGHLLGADRDERADDGLRAAHSSLYAAYWARLRPLPGARRLLERCRARGLRSVLCTSASKAELGALLACLDADPLIDTVTSADDAGESKPAPDIVEVALKRSGLSADEVVFVGDSVWDVQAAGHLAIPCIGLTSGGVSAAELLDHGAATVYEHPQDLCDHLDEALTTAFRVALSHT